VGQEIATQLRLDGRIIDVTALLETDTLVFRGGATMTIPFAEMFSVEASSGWLELKTPRGLLLLELGPKAEVWKEKIKNPKALVEKLGLDATKKVAVVGKLDAELRADIDGSGAKVAKTARGKDFDVVFLAAYAKKDLEKVAAAKETIAEDGAIWIVYPKATATGVKVDPELTERAVLTAGRTLTLTDNKQVKVNDDLTAVRFVIPASYRKRKK
jgi:methylmalonyl-CoA mutase cobalamin-binding subunit